MQDRALGCGGDEQQQRETAPQVQHFLRGEVDHLVVSRGTADDRMFRWNVPSAFT